MDFSVTDRSLELSFLKSSRYRANDGSAAPMLMEEQERRGLKPEAYVGDMAYCAAELRQQAAEGGTEIVARVPPASAPVGCFSNDAFNIDLKAGSITCPAAQTTQRMHRSASGGPTFYLDGKVCAGCALREACTRQRPEVMRRTGRGRSIRIHPLEAVIQRTREVEGTERVQRLLERRPVVERRLAHLSRIVCTAVGCGRRVTMGPRHRSKLSPPLRGRPGPAGSTMATTDAGLSHDSFRQLSKQRAVPDDRPLVAVVG
jgi:hypothetical protein